MASTIFIKDPDAVLDYGFDWSQWLESGETISTSSWTVPSGLTKNSDGNSTTETSVWIAGGTVNTDYTIINHITTSEGRQDDRSMIIKVRER